MGERSVSAECRASWALPLAPAFVLSEGPFCRPALGLQGGTLLLINARSCPRFALGNVFEASSNPQCAAASAGRAGLCRDVPGGTPRRLSKTLGPRDRPASGPRHLTASTCLCLPLPAGRLAGTERALGGTGRMGPRALEWSPVPGPRV